jgi:hypothetical protein
VTKRFSPKVNLATRAGAAARAFVDQHRLAVAVAPDAQEPGWERVQRAALQAAHDGEIEALLKLADSASAGPSNSSSKCRGYVPCARSGRHAARLAGRCGDTRGTGITEARDALQPAVAMTAAGRVPSGARNAAGAGSRASRG